MNDMNYDYRWYQGSSGGISIIIYLFNLLLKSVIKRLSGVTSRLFQSNPLLIKIIPASIQIKDNDVEDQDFLET